MQATDPLKDFEDASEDFEASGETQDSGEFPDENQEDDTSWKLILTLTNPT